ncbi:hypothetical protein FACS1894168_0210 [Deltaproteobacteria bacterium]|nr:hypothetical protein FACS1894168_0190 [Deltaproteobacteria bacterium]GHV49862.1 hypothetical protein FACS1894168_0210 [Deltaproteobacteria bacterium]
MQAVAAESVARCRGEGGKAQVITDKAAVQGTVQKRRAHYGNAVAGGGVDCTIIGTAINPTEPAVNIAAY